METFTIAFWKEPVSKDDSNVELHELHEAGLAHGTVTRTVEATGTRYVVDLHDTALQQHYGRIILSRTPDKRWNVVNAMDNIEDIFIQLTEAIEAGEREP